MVYRCVHCSKIYSDGSDEIISGCSNCKSKFFFYIREEKLKEILANKDLMPELSSREKKQIENDVRDIMGAEDEESPIFLDFESISIVKPGKYLLDLTKLFAKDKPKVYKLEDGKYIIDLSNLISAKEKDKQTI